MIRIIKYTFLCFIFIYINLSLTHAQIANVEFREKNFPGNEAEFKSAFEALQQGDYYFLRGSVYYDKAVSFYLTAQKFNPNNADLNYQIGLCYLGMQTNRLKALPYLEKARNLNQQMGNEFLFSLGLAYHYNLDFDKAIQVYEAYKKTAVGSGDNVKISKAAKAIQECNFGKELVKKPIKVRIDNLGPNINSRFPDYAPVITTDENKLIFTSRREGTTGGMVDDIDSLFFEDIYISYKIENEWAPAKNIGAPINKDDHDASVNLSSDGKKLLIYRTDNGGDIFECSLEGIEWSEPEALKKINTKGYENHATYSSDGTQFYFTAIRNDSSGLGSKDIYVADVDGEGNMKNIRNAGPSINTLYDEDGVFCHPDGKTLYFSSKGHSSMGGFDIFKTKLENGNWSLPENIGYPINSPEDDIFFIISKDEKRAYFSSYREEGFGDKDIYMMTFMQDAEMLSSLQFSVKDSLEELLLDANIKIKDLATGEIVTERKIDKGETIANLMVGKSYEIIVSANKYAPYTEVIELPIEAGSQIVFRNIELSKDKQATVSGILTDKSSVIPISGEIQFLDDATREVVKTTFANKQGSYSLDLPTGKKYVVNVKSSGYAYYEESYSIPSESKGLELKKDFSLIKLDRTLMSVLKGRIYDAATGDTIVDVSIKMNEYGGQPVLFYQKNGRYDCIVFNGASHTIVVSKEGYLSYTQDINIPFVKDKLEIIKDIPLIRAEKGAKTVLSNIFFDFNKSTLRPSSYKSINTLLSTLKRYPTMVIEISGHTDNVGSAKYNQKLSDNRSKVVKDYLVRNGIDASRLAAVGKSFREPIATNETNEGRQLNRRTEIKIIRMK
jgi:outer membrane protein OmpA-like peptidoglycan-associated protein/tetratricopeptide (TPR) repeat protein